MMHKKVIAKIREGQPRGSSFGDRLQLDLAGLADGQVPKTVREINKNLSQIIHATMARNAAKNAQRSFTQVELAEQLIKKIENCFKDEDADVDIDLVNACLIAYQENIERSEADHGITPLAELLNRWSAIEDLRPEIKECFKRKLVEIAAQNIQVRVGSPNPYGDAGGPELRTETNPPGQSIEDISTLLSMPNPEHPQRILLKEALINLRIELIEDPIQFSNLIGNWLRIENLALGFEKILKEFLNTISDLELEAQGFRQNPTANVLESAKRVHELLHEIEELFGIKGKALKPFLLATVPDPSNPEKPIQTPDDIRRPCFLAIMKNPDKVHQKLSNIEAKYSLPAHDEAKLREFLEDEDNHDEDKLRVFLFNQITVNVQSDPTQPAKILEELRKNFALDELDLEKVTAFFQKEGMPFEDDFEEFLGFPLSDAQGCKKPNPGYYAKLVGGFDIKRLNESCINLFRLAEENHILTFQLTLVTVFGGGITQIIDGLIEYASGTREWDQDLPADIPVDGSRFRCEMVDGTPTVVQDIPIPTEERGPKGEIVYQKDEHEEIIYRTIRGGDDDPYELERRWLRIYLKAINPEKRSSSGSPMAEETHERVLLSFTDVSEVKEAEQKALEAEKRAKIEENKAKILAAKNKQLAHQLQVQLAMLNHTIKNLTLTSWAPLEGIQSFLANLSQLMGHALPPLDAQLTTGVEALSTSGLRDGVDNLQKILGNNRVYTFPQFEREVQNQILLLRHNNELPSEIESQLMEMIDTFSSPNYLLAKAIEVMVFKNNGELASKLSSLLEALGEFQEVSPEIKEDLMYLKTCIKTTMYPENVIFTVQRILANCESVKGDRYQELFDILKEIVGAFPSEDHQRKLLTQLSDIYGAISKNHMSPDIEESLLLAVTSYRDQFIQQGTADWQHYTQLCETLLRAYLIERAKALFHAIFSNATMLQGNKDIALSPAAMSRLTKVGTLPSVLFQQMPNLKIVFLPNETEGGFQNVQRFIQLFLLCASVPALQDVERVGRIISEIQRTSFSVLRELSGQDPEEGTIVIQDLRWKLQDHLNNLINGMKSEHPGLKLKGRVSAPPHAGVTEIHASEYLLFQAFGNLMINAVKYATEAILSRNYHGSVGEILLALDFIQDPEGSGKVLLKFDMYDTGTGVSRKVAGRMFKTAEESLQEAEHAQGGEEQQNFGFGASHAVETIRTYGGQIEVAESKTQRTNHFTRIRGFMYFPTPRQINALTPPLPTPRREAREELLNFSRCPILLVDDTPSVLKPSIMALGANPKAPKDYAFNVAIATDGLEMADAVIAQKARVCFSDQNMTHLNGVDAIRAIKGLWDSSVFEADDVKKASGFFTDGSPSLESGGASSRAASASADYSEESSPPDTRTPTSSRKRHYTEEEIAILRNCKYVIVAGVELTTFLEEVGDCHFLDGFVTKAAAPQVKLLTTAIRHFYSFSRRAEKTQELVDAEIAVEAVLQDLDAEDDQTGSQALESTFEEAVKALEVVLAEDSPEGARAYGAFEASNCAREQFYSQEDLALKVAEQKRAAKAEQAADSGDGEEKKEERKTETTVAGEATGS